MKSSRVLQQIAGSLCFIRKLLLTLILLIIGAASWIASGAAIPIANTRTISQQSLSGGTLNGDVTPLGLPATAWFEWGTNINYGISTSPINVGNSSNAVTVRAAITGLESGRTYHYRVVATNVNGRANGLNQSFTQPVYPDPAGTPPVRSTYYDGSFLNAISYDARPEWDGNVPMTIEAWVYRRDANRYETIVSHDWPGSYWLGFAPRLRFYRGTNFAEVLTPVPAFKWTHVAVSYDGAVARFYINGDYIGARPLSNSGAGKVRTLRLGHNGPGGLFLFARDVFSGNLDEVRIWNVARGSDDIAAGMFQELRAESGLAAIFPRGGRVELVSGLVGYGNATEQVYGMLSRDLVVPKAAIQPNANGQINVSSEYLGADQLVLRYPDDPTIADGIAYFIHTDNDLFVGVAGHRRNEGFNWPYTNTWLGLFLDTTYERPPLAERAQVQVVAYQDYNTNHTAWLNGDGGGGYFPCIIDFGGIIPPRPCTPRSLWQVGEALCGDDVDPPPPCTEFRISRTLLGTWDEYDGVALGHFNFNQFADQTFVPEEGFPDSPGTWLTMSYGEGSARLPRVRFAGRVRDGLENSSPGLAGWRVSFFAGGAVYTNLTDLNGQFSFDVPMPTGQVVYAQIPNVGFGRYRLPTIYPGGQQPSLVATNEVRFPPIAPGTVGMVTLANVDFYIQRPLPATAILSAEPVSPTVGFSGRSGIPGGMGERVRIFGTNLHAEVEISLSPYTTFINPPQWTLLRAPVIAIAPDRTWVDVQAPYVPERVPIFQGSVTVNSFQSNWRWVAYDRWTRPGMLTYSYFGNFGLKRPPYPLVHGFNFDNQGGSASLDEFLACYGYNAYLCVGAFGFCATHVPNPIYAGIWFPVYKLWVGASGGSCVGMASTSLQLYHGTLHPSDFDPLALAGIGISNPGFPGDWDTSNFGGRFTRPPKPKDVWARIRMNHGAQTSAEYILQVLTELDIGLSSFGGNPVARLNGLRANPTSRTISMIPGIGGGHCVTPYRVEDNVGGDPNISRIWLYDNNAPCGLTSSAGDGCVTSQFIDIDHAANKYHFPSQNWNGTGLFTVPVSLYNGERHMPGLDDIAAAVAVLIVIVAGDADGHYATGNGEWGWRADGTFVDNFPGLRSLTPVGSPYNYTRSVPVLVPMSNGPPAIELNIRGTNACIFHAGINGTALQLEKAVGQAGERDRIEMAGETNQLTAFRYIPQSNVAAFTPRIGLQFTSNAFATFQWQGLEGEGGRTQEFRALKSHRAVEYCNLTSRATRHSLRVETVEGGSSNVTCALFGPFHVPTGAVHCVVLQDWPRTKQIRSELDLDADGKADQIEMISGTAIDSDADGLPDEWELVHQLDVEQIDCDTDADKDGVSNYGEYLSGTDPRDPASVLRLTAAYLPSGKVRLTWTAVPGRRYEILYTDDFWQVFRPLADPSFPRTAAGTIEHFEDAAPAGEQRTRFYRLRVLP